MRRDREIFLWTFVLVVGVLLVFWAWPRAFPLFPTDWDFTRFDAEAVALERLRDLGEPVEDPYVVVQLDARLRTERRMLLADIAQDHWLKQDLLVWQVEVFPEGATPRDWAYRARISPHGKLLGLERRLPEGEGGIAVAQDAAVEQARALLMRMGFDLDAFESEPEMRFTQVSERTDLTVRFRRLEAGEDGLPMLDYGVAVAFQGEELGGFFPWVDDSASSAAEGLQRGVQSVYFARFFLIILLVFVVSIPFLKLYHSGEIGIRRSLHFFLLVAVVGLIQLALISRSASGGWNIGFFTREQMTWFIFIWAGLLEVAPVALLAFMSWSVGELHCRRTFPQKLAAIDALFRGRWGNATVALSALRGVACGVLLTAVTFVGAVALTRFDVWSGSAYAAGEAFATLAPSVTLVASRLQIMALLLLTGLMVPAWAVSRFGRGRGMVVAILVGGAVLNPLIPVLPAIWTIPGSLLVAAALVLSFLFGDVLSALLCGLSAGILTDALPYLLSGDPILQFHGGLAVAVLVLPLTLSLRHLANGEEFAYTWDDIPPHVRRIAERERQRVEIETARGIQSSILPELPPQLAGVEIASKYLPASEVGGDFYDVLALEDGRLAVAVGDVAGHGVSSGLVMSMAKSALAVQVTFDPEVEAVVATLNRMVYQSARKRLLTTLCYAVLDPVRRELCYASAGHLYPYQVTQGGKVRALEAGAYPLGVRGEIDIRVRHVSVEPGETLFLYSDGLVEATPELRDEPFGFERLEASLGRHAGKSPSELRDGVLADVLDFTGSRPREDDVTVLVLRLPAA